MTGNANPTFNTFHLLNIQSIKSRRENKYVELEKHLEKYKPSAMLLTETWLTEKQNFAMPRYDIIRTDRPTGKRGGGTAILINKNYAHERITFKDKLEQIEITAIKIICENNPLAVAVIHKKPNNKIIKRELEIVMNTLKTITDDIIIGGDFNASHFLYGSNINSNIPIFTHSKT